MTPDKSTPGQGLRFPLYLSRVAAGFPSPADDHIEARLSLDELCIRHPDATFFLRASGDSMTGAGIFDGDILVVDRARTARSGSVVVAVVDGGFTCKRLLIDRDRVWLRAEQPGYPDIFPEEGVGLEIFGVVTHCVHKLPV